MRETRDQIMDGASVALRRRDGRQFMRVLCSNGLHVGDKVAAVFGARVGGVRGVRRTRSARMLPDATALIPMEAQRLKSGLL